MTSPIVSESCLERSSHLKAAPSGDMKPELQNSTQYQTYREALSLIRHGISQGTQIEAFDFLADIYKKAPLHLRPVFVMALISTLSSFSFALKDMEETQEGDRP